MSQPSRRLARRRPQARGFATQRRLLDAAEELFTRAGYEGASMADVAERAGAGVGTLYHHFSDKRALLLALVDDWGDRELARSRREHDLERFLAGDSRAAITDELRVRYERLRRDGSFWLVLLALAERDGEVRRRLHRVEQVAIERLRDRIALAQRRGSMRARLDPLAAAILVRRSIELAATEVFVRRLAEPAPERMLEELTDMICRYLLEEPDR
jgi:AcrR family transcriptional regulator